VHDGNPAFSLRPGYSDDSSDNLWTAKLQLDWRPTDDLLVYAGVNRGVKAGSFNAALPDAVKGPLPLEFVPYDEEVLTSFEVGFKSDLWGGHTRLNGSMYYYDYEDYQAFLFVSVGGYVINVDAETTGIELELQSSPIDGLDLLLSAAYFDSEIKDLPLQAGSSTLIDVEPTNAPQVQFTGLARYAWDMFGGTMAIQGDASYSDEAWYNIRNFDTHSFDDYWIYNAQLTWEDGNGNWLVSLIGRNLSDERAGIQGYDVSLICDCSEVSYRAPRWYGASIRYSF
jgi:iron complex outermembrane receptor protein